MVGEFCDRVFRRRRAAHHHGIFRRGVKVLLNRAEADSEILSKLVRRWRHRLLLGPENGERNVYGKRDYDWMRYGQSGCNAYKGSSSYDQPLSLWLKWPRICSFDFLKDDFFAYFLTRINPNSIKPTYCVIQSDGRLTVEFNLEDHMRIKSWNFYIRA